MNENPVKRRLPKRTATAVVLVAVLAIAFFGMQSLLVRARPTRLSIVSPSSLSMSPHEFVLPSLDEQEEATTVAILKGTYPRGSWTRVNLYALEDHRITLVNELYVGRSAYHGPASEEMQIPLMIVRHRESDALKTRIAASRAAVIPYPTADNNVDVSASHRSAYVGVLKAEGETIAYCEGTTPVTLTSRTTVEEIAAIEMAAFLILTIGNQESH